MIHTIDFTLLSIFGLIFLTEAETIVYMYWDCFSLRVPVTDILPGPEALGPGKRK